MSTCSQLKQMVSYQQHFIQTFIHVNIDCTKQQQGYFGMTIKVHTV